MEPPPAGAAPASPASKRAASLFLRLLTVACLVISIILLTTNSVTVELQQSAFEILFKDVYAYRYVLSAAVVGLAYTVMQTFFTISQIATGISESNHLLDFYGDKVMSYVIATGSAAGFGVTKDLKDFVLGLISLDSTSTAPIDNFFNKGYASASLLLFAFVCTAVLSVFSSYALPKRHTES